jgi:hypothetical protein
VKDCAFNRFRLTNDWERCHFRNSKLNGFNGGRFTAKDCDFADCSIFGLRDASLRLSGCTFEGTDLQGNWWEPPSELLFKDCTIRTKDDAPFLRLGGYTVGRIGFDGCTVSGKQALVDVKDLRRIQLPPNAAPETNPDNKPGSVLFRRTKWEGEAKTVLTHAKDANPSPKRISIVDKDNDWPEDVAVATDLPPTWELR